MDDVVPHVAWSVSQNEFKRMATDAEGDRAICVFMASEDIPNRARSGYVSLVIAYAREHEPVTALDDGSAALLVLSGGIKSGEIAAQRMMQQLQRLSLHDTVQVGIAPLTDDVEGAVQSAREVAAQATPGTVVTAQ